ncbi:MAG: PEP-CTERM sorting domain-containing protein [Planctomycetota bacterium]
MYTKTFALIAAAATALPAAAQTFDIVLEEGDTVPGIGVITRVDGVATNNLGDILIEVDTDGADTTKDGALLLNGSVFLGESESLAAPVGAGAGSFDDFQLTNDGRVAQNLFLDGTTGSGDDSGLYFDKTLLIQESEAITASGPLNGSTVAGFFGTQVNDGPVLLSRISLDGPGSSIISSLITFDIATGDQVVLAAEGQTLPGLGGELILDIESDADEYDYNNSGTAIFGLDLEGDSSTDGVVYLTGTGVLAREGDVSPVGGFTWDGLASSEVALGDGGDFAFTGNFDTGATNDDSGVFLNGSLFAREGDVAPGTGGRLYTNLAFARLEIDQAGNLLWVASIDGDSATNRVLYLNDEILLQEGDLIDGKVITQLSTSDQTLSLSDDGRFALVELVLDGSTDAVVLITIPEPATASLLGLASLGLLRRRR